MTSLLKRLMVAFAIGLLPVGAYAQEATLAGTVTDMTGGVLPGVTVTAVHEATGNVFETVTDGAGTFRLPVRVGQYRITAALTGFTTVVRPGVDLLLGRQAVVNLQMGVSTLQETVTVTGEAPLLDVTGSTVGGNIDPRQMQELPINGRNWMDLSLLTPGARRNESGGFVQDRQGYAQTYLDGQQVTTIYHSGGDDEQPGFSRDSIAEFEVVANRFDATQGRSAGMIVNAITKSGTNTFDGTASGYFRHDTFNAKDFIAGRVLPYSNQQVVGTFGGPIVRDRLHFFGVYEYGREPKTFIYNTPFPSFNTDLQLTDRVHKPLGRVDYQINPATRLSVRGSGYNNLIHVGGGSASTPGGAGRRARLASQYNGTFTQVVSSQSVNEIKVGRTAYERREDALVRWKGGPFPYPPILEGGSPVIVLRGISLGGSVVTPLNVHQDTWSVRDDFTTSYNWGGRHNVKLGGEYMWFNVEFQVCWRCQGWLDARGGPVPSNLAELFPDTLDASTWNLAPLAPITTKVVHGVSSTGFRYGDIRHLVAGWLQDDWQASDRLTVNLGVRYDFDSNAHSERLRFMPWLPGDLPRDKNNIAPRVGMNYRLDDRTVLRGGYGIFFAFAPNDGVQQAEHYLADFEYEITNDGRPDFVPNWFGPGASPEGRWGGPQPTFDEAIRNACDQNNSAPGCVYRSLGAEITYPGRQTPYSHQASVGVQRQLRDDTSLEVNYVYTGGRLEEDSQNVNLTFNPATGTNYPFRDVSRRAFPGWGVVNLEILEGWSNYHATDVTLTKRFSSRWQATGTYTLAYFRDANPFRDQWFIGDDGVVARRPIGFALTSDLGGEYTLAETDQRHRGTINGIWEVGYGVQLSGLYFYASGERRSTNTGQDRRNIGTGSGRLRSDGTLLARNGFVGEPIHRVDLRLQKRLSLGGGTTIDGLLEAFNVFDHANYGNYVLDESNPRFGQPTFNNNIAYQPRMLQLGFRLAF